MLSGVPGVLNPANSMLRVVRESRNDLATSEILNQKANQLLDSVRPSTALPSMRERFDISQQLNQLRYDSKIRTELVDVIVQLHGDGPVYGTIRRNNFDIDQNLNNTESTIDVTRDKINHAIKLGRVNQEFATLRDFMPQQT